MRAGGHSSLACHAVQFTRIRPGLPAGRAGAGSSWRGASAGRRWALRWLVARQPVLLRLVEREVRPAAGGIDPRATIRFGQRILRLHAAADARAARRWLIVGCRLNLALLGWFKYANFLVHAAACRSARARAGHLPAAGDQLLHLSADHVPGGELTAAIGIDAGLLPYAAFVAFFPHLIAGPIVRPREIMPQLAGRRPGDAARGEPRRGLDDLSARVWRRSSCWPTPLRASPMSALSPPRRVRRSASSRPGTPRRPTRCRSTSISPAIPTWRSGLARMLNVRFPLNFASPYQATNIADFWRRWHITLSRFLRDYVYIPLGGNRHGEARRNLNLMATMLLGGLWHGAAWNFVLWGGLHGLYLVVHGQFRVAASCDCRPRIDAACCHRRLGAVPRKRHGRDDRNAARHAGMQRHRIAADDRACFPAAGRDRDTGATAALSRRCANAELSRGLGLPGCSAGRSCWRFRRCTNCRNARAAGR